jgi:hypothetical protein
MSHASSSPQHDGGCLCGAIRYRVAGAPIAANVCYCTQCLRQTGAAMPAFVSYPTDRFSLLAGAPARYRSSSFATREFCATCGSSLFWRRDGADELDVFLGTLDEPARMPPPSDQQWSQHRAPWVPAVLGIPDYPGKRGAP